MVKNINDTVSLRIVLFIKEFEVDLYQKKTCLAVKPNINRSKEIVSEMKKFMWNFSQVKLLLNLFNILFFRFVRFFLVLNFFK